MILKINSLFHLATSAGLTFLFSSALQAQTVPVPLLNPAFLDEDADRQPDKWKSSVGADGEKVKILSDGSSVRIVDQDKANGAGIAQYVDVKEGHKYKFSAKVKGSGGLWLYLQFFDAIPVREGDISKKVMLESRQSTSASEELKEFTVTATAPIGAKKARLWFYCPKIGVTDSLVQDPKLEDLGAVPVAVVTAPSTTASGHSATLANSDLKDEDGDNLPDGWRVFPDASGDATKVVMSPTGGVQLVDNDKTKGIGIQQQLPAQEGVTYTFKATLKGTSGVSLNFQFLKGKPARDSELRSLMIEEKRVFATGTPEGKETVLTAKAPVGTKFMRIWLYSPNIGLTDVVVTKATLESVAPTLVGGSVSAANSKLIFTGDFESGAVDGWETQFPHSTKGGVVTSPVRAGKYAMRNELTYADFKAYGDSRNRRSEIYKENVGRPGEERWYGFSIYLPKDWEEPETFDIVMQIHNKPDHGEVAKSPILTLETHGKDWKVNNRWDKEKISKPAKNGAGGTITSNVIWQGAYQTEKWTDWVFHVKWSLGDDGLVEVWKDGQKVGELKGPNAYNDEQPFYMKIGVYKPAYRVTAPPQRVIYHDEVRIGNENASYADVAPGGDKLLP